MPAVTRKRSFTSWRLAGQKKPSKYRSRRTTVDGITFHSAKEANRYVDLKLLERCGKIANLELQPFFELHALPQMRTQWHASTRGGRRQRRRYAPEPLEAQALRDPVWHHNPDRLMAAKIHTDVVLDRGPCMHCGRPTLGRTKRRSCWPCLQAARKRRRLSPKNRGSSDAAWAEAKNAQRVRFAQNMRAVKAMLPLPIQHRPEPTRCACGATALYRNEAGEGFCKAHKYLCRPSMR
jgi:hypothetical protein